MPTHSSRTFVLDAVTLEGIGSYIAPARLEIKPFTVLCGKNGSGKSTWLKALRVLKDSARMGRLPYSFHTTDWQSNNIQITNAMYHLASYESLTSEMGVDAEQSVLGGIGLEFHFESSSLESSEKEHEKDSFQAANEFFYQQIGRHGLRFKIQLAHPTHRSDSQLTPHLKHLVSLTINDCFSVRLIGERDPLQRFEAGHRRPRRTKGYFLQIGAISSANAVSGSSIEYVDVGFIRNLIDLEITSLNEAFSTESLTFLFQNFETRITDLLNELIDSVFILDSIRPHQMLTNLDDHDSARAFVEEWNKRDVGYYGENSWQIATNNERDVLGGFEAFCFSEADAFVLHSVFSSGYLRENFEKIRWIYSHLSIDQQQHFEKSDQRSTQVDYPSIAQWFNDLLSNRSLWNRSLWEEVEECPYPEGGEDHHFFPNPEIASLLEDGTDSLSDAEWKTLVYHQIVDAVCELGNKYLPCHDFMFFGEYISWWVKRLLGVEYQILSERTKTLPVEVLKSLNCRVVHKAFEKPTNYRSESRRGNSNLSLSRLYSPCFGADRPETLQPPRQFSSAFHQVFPMIVQLGIMKKGELFGIENPEVHLHPSLQVQVTESLIEHAKSGRRLILETHSDLLLRRTIRAILQEEIPQSAVAIYCINLNDRRTVSVNEERTTFLGSTLEPITVDENGHIDNWPEGFLDEDTRESQRLLDIMYGRVEEELDD
jgi:predicted ATPase